MGGMGLPGYQALRESSAWIDLRGRGKILARGEDRARLLHALTTNHIEELTPGRGCYAFFLNAQGHILGDANIFCMEELFLLDTEPETASKLYAHIDKHIIADDVTLEDSTQHVATVAVEGPTSAATLGALGAPIPDAEYAHVAWGTRIVCHVSTTGSGGFLIFLPSEEKAGLTSELEAAGAVYCDEACARTVRIENGVPRYGDDFTEANLPQETGIARALHFNKGCYLGQEIVERIRSRGHVNRCLVRLEIDAGEVPATGAVLFDGENEAGYITSAVLSPVSGKVVAFAYVDPVNSRRGTRLALGGASATVV
ncbi:MAG: glycine cleavage T C-terminal barrel domain-containing protein [Bryobacteraceae bacterium]